MSEAVNHPAHYGGDTTYETIKVLEAWLTPEEYRGFLKGNAIKYLSRAGKKGSRAEDLAKGRWYLEREQQLPEQDARSATAFKDVAEFHRKFDLPAVGHPDFKPGFVEWAAFDFRLRFLEEELDELRTAYEAGDLPGVADALVDLVYVALGTAHYFGIPFDAVWAEVHAANMKKERATSAEQSKRGSTLDVVKPAGWTPPDVAGVLRRHGWRG